MHSQLFFHHVRLFENTLTLTKISMEAAFSLSLYDHIYTSYRSNQVGHSELAITKERTLSHYTGLFEIYIFPRYIIECLAPGPLY